LLGVPALSVETGRLNRAMPASQEQDDIFIVTQFRQADE
jgi:hypothetical protein